VKAFLRNHPLFAVVLFLLIGAGLALSVLTVMAQGDRAAALRASLAADDEARALWTRPVSPIQANVEAMEAEYNRRVDALNGLRAELGFVAEERRRGVPDISATYDGNARALLSELVGFVDRFERQSPAPAETTALVLQSITAC